MSTNTSSESISAFSEIIPDQLKKELAVEFTAALKGNDWEKMKSIMVEEITWTLPGTSLLSGLADGREAVIRRAQSLKKFGVNFELLHVLIGMHGFTLSLHNTARRNELILDEYVAIVFGLKNGKIVQMTTYLHDVDGINNFFIDGII